MLDELVNKKETQLQTMGYIKFTSEELENLDLKLVEQIENHFRGHAMMMLPDSEILVVQRFIEFLLEKADPLLLAMAMAPEDDESLTEEDEVAIEKAEKAILEGNVKSLDQVAKELGI